MRNDRYVNSLLFMEFDAEWKITKCYGKEDMLAKAERPSFIIVNPRRKGIEKKMIVCLGGRDKGVSQMYSFELDEWC